LLETIQESANSDFIMFFIALRELSSLLGESSGQAL
jgi:hypothetical protein